MARSRLSSTPSSRRPRAQRYDASGRLVTPGLVDLHTHYGPLISGIGLPADELVPISATTTAVSAGDAGANTFGALKHWAIGPSRTRLYAFVHISAIGLSGGLAVPEMQNIAYAKWRRARARSPRTRSCSASRCGSPITSSAERRRAAAAGHCSGPDGRQGLPRHVPHRFRPGLDGGPARPPTPRRHLDPRLYGRRQQHRPERPVIPAAKAAKQRGVIFDVGHGGGTLISPCANRP